jgi:hypothetical protein
MYMGGALTERRGGGGGGTCWAVPFIYWLFILSEWAESEARHFLFTVVVILFSLEFTACESHDSFA